MENYNPWSCDSSHDLVVNFLQFFSRATILESLSYKINFIIKRPNQSEIPFKEKLQLLLFYVKSIVEEI